MDERARRAKQRQRRGRRRRWPWWTAGSVALAVLATSCTGWTMLNRINDSVGRVDPFHGLAGRPDDGDSLDFLVVGTDERAGVPRAVLESLHAGGESCDCTDTILLVHLSKDRSRATVVSIPRDSYVEIPAHRDKYTGKQVAATHGKINAAYGMGGPALTVQTVEQATGLRIDHYVQVNFLSFVSTVDALGGVRICTPIPLHDPMSGLDLAAGTHRLNGAEALKYVRARHVDGSADLGRMQRQQKFVAQLMQQVRSSGTLLDPARLNDVLGAVLRSVKVDKGLTVQGMVGLAAGMKGLSAAGSSFATVPASNVDYRVPGWGSTLLWDKPAAARMFAAIGADRPIGGPSPAPSPSSSSSSSSGTGSSSSESAPRTSGGAAAPRSSGTGDGVRTGDQVACP